MRIPVPAFLLLFAVLGFCVPVVRAADEQPATEAAPQSAPQSAPQAAPPVPQPGAESPPVTPPAPQPTPSAAPAAEPKPQSGPLPTQLPAPQPANDQVIEPQVERRPVKVPHIPSNNFEVGIFGGAYDTENFGTNAVGGARLGYHITEDVFVEAVYGQTKVSDATFRLFLPGGIFPTQEQILRYYELDAGYNILPGEIFIGRTHAKVSAVYVVAGLGSTKFDGQSNETVDFGLGMRVFLADWVSLQCDMLDHVFSMDILGTRKDMQNIELTTGVTFFF